MEDRLPWEPLPAYVEPFLEHQGITPDSIAAIAFTRPRPHADPEPTPHWQTPEALKHQQEYGMPPTGPMPIPRMPDGLFQQVDRRHNIPDSQE